MQRDVEVDHLTDWTLTEWWLHYLGALATPFAAALLLFTGFLAAIWLLETLRPADLAEKALVLIGAVTAVGITVLSLYIHVVLLYDSLRHAATMTRSVLAALPVAAVLAFAACALAIHLGVERGRWLALVGGTASLPALGCLVADRLTRWAAAIPMALSTFLALIALGLIWVAVAALDRR